MLTHEIFNELLNYDPITGLFIWKRNRGGGVKAGDIAGRIGVNGYRYMCIDSKQYLAHRVAWFISNGKWPDGEVDHINGDVADNRLINLRDVSPHTNKENIRKAYKSKRSSNMLGVFKSPGRKKWRAQIRVNGKSIHLGCFSTEMDAHLAYLRKKRELHNGCTI